MPVVWNQPMSCIGQFLNYLLSQRLDLVTHCQRDAGAHLIMGMMSTPHPFTDYDQGQFRMIKKPVGIHYHVLRIPYCLLYAMDW